MKTQKFYLAFLATLLCMGSYAQSPREYIRADKERSAGYYYHYETPEVSVQTQTRPDGYTPFYISHYGRHGCRWHVSANRYQGLVEVLKGADEQHQLTETGLRFYEQMKVIAADAEGRCGDLTPRGARTHKGIAQRMYRTYPEVFQPGAVIDSKSTVIIRCVLSMAAFNEGLKEVEPKLNISRESSERNMKYLAHHTPNLYRKEISATLDSLQQAWVPTDRFMKSLFKDNGACLEGKITPQTLMYHSFELAGLMQDVDYLGIDLYYLFNEEELYQLWKYLNARSYVYMGPSLKYGDRNLNDAGNLLRNIVETADRVIAGEEKVDATLRFGHDSCILPLVSLMELKGADVRVPFWEAEGNWNISKMSPMGTNLQLIFFKNKTGNVKVRVLYCEKDAGLPVKGAPFYDWKDLRAFWMGKYQN